MKKHKTVILTNKTLGIKAYIDEEIAPLIAEIWKAGIRTRWSCQDMRGQIQVAFSTAEHASTFLNIITEFEPGGKSLYNKISHSGCRGIIAWKYEINPYDTHYDWDNDCVIGEPNIVFLIHILFPRSDLEIILHRLRKHNLNR